MGKVLQICSEVLEVSMESINMETQKDDLEEWDSLTHIQLILEIEKNYDIKIPIEDTAKIRKIGDFLKYTKGE